MHSSATRLIAGAAGAALLVAAIGLAWELARFGGSARAAADRVEYEVRQSVAGRARQVQALAERVAHETDLITRAAATRDGLAPLFARVTDVAAATDPDAVSVTVYAPAGPPGQFRVLAWSDGPAEDLTADRLAGPRGLYVAPSPLGLLLVFVQPVEAGGKRVGVAAAQTVLSPVARSGAAAGSYQLETSFGAVGVTQAYAGAAEAPRRADSFVINADGGGTPLLDVAFSTEMLSASRSRFRERALAIAALPLVGALLLLTGPVFERRRVVSRAAGPFLGWSLVAGAMIAAAGVVMVWLAPMLGGRPALAQMLSGLTAFGLVSVFFVSWWWRRPRRIFPSAAPLRFLIEQLVAGVGFAAGLLAVARLLDARINGASLDTWQLPIFPAEPGAVLFLLGLLLGELALGWAAALLLAIMATRWRLGSRHIGLSALAAVLWVAPTVVLVALPHRFQPLPGLGLLVAAASGVLFALFAGAARRFYRRTTQPARLILFFVALLAPALALYPAAWFHADAATRALVTGEYAPATAGYPQELRAELTRTAMEIDRIPMPQLLQLVATGGATGPAVDTRLAYSVWNGTSLSRARATSAIELYGANGSLVSRFALNVPEYRTTAQARTWQGTSCDWNVFSEVIRFGAEERSMLHGERGLCDADRRLRGGVVVHLVQDYEALPFVSSANPYYDVLQAGEETTRGDRVADLQVVVYGWSLHPVFASGNVAWAIPAAHAEQLSASREPRWTRLAAGTRAYEVHLSNDSGGIYAIGYPTPTLLGHLMRVAATATLTALLFVLWLFGAAVYVPIARSRPSPLRTLFHEIRTSFYRKLFLFFVLAAVGPVLMLTLAFNAYMTAKLRDDVESESKSVVTVARRVLEELVALQQHPDDQPQAVLTDDVMVWIGHVLKRDVNLFQGSTLSATSQRDLFESGLLPVRTPAAAYRAIALSRLPTNVTEEPLGALHYLVAAAPVPARGPDAVLSVPLALRQREIQRDIDELNRGVLVGAVFVILFAAGLGASVARRIADPVARLTRATRQIAAGKLDVRIVADTADELRRLVDDFNGMAATLDAQRAELARTNQLKAWAEMARQVAHEIKNPLTPIQLAAEHLQRVHEDQRRPLGPVFDQCVTTILQQVKLLRRIAGEFSTFAGQPTPRITVVSPAELADEVIRPYRAGLGGRIQIDVDVPAALPPVRVDRTLATRALTNVVENAVQAMTGAGRLRVTGRSEGDTVRLTFVDTGVGMEAGAVARAFEPYFSTKAAGSGLGLANARRNVELFGGMMALESVPGVGTTVTVTLPAAPARSPAAS